MGNNGLWNAAAQSDLPQDTYSFTVLATDIADNEATTNGVVTIDTTPPQNFTAQLDPVSDSGSFQNDGITKITTPNFLGTSEAESRVTITINGTNGLNYTAQYTVDVPANGQWSFE
ncbi:Ig-like domain-containing protein, partial [Arthrospira platensis SPKY1]|nr:Ig-like domain-containing protein [Arthrospira platensis SPKY1]